MSEVITLSRRLHGHKVTVDTGGTFTATVKGVGKITAQSYADLDKNLTAAQKVSKRTPIGMEVIVLKSEYDTECVRGTLLGYNGGNGCLRVKVGRRTKTVDSSQHVQIFLAKDEHMVSRLLEVHGEIAACQESLASLHEQADNLACGRYVVPSTWVRPDSVARSESNLKKSLEELGAQK